MNNIPPFGYEWLNIEASAYSPSTTRFTDNALSEFFRRALFQDALALWKMEDAPDYWDEGYYMPVLLLNGFFAILETSEMGLIPLNCFLGGEYNYMYQPTKAMFANPALPFLKERIIDEDCIIVRFKSDYSGIYPMLRYYSDKLALASASFDTNVLNSKLAYFLMAANKAGAASLKKVLDSILSGEPAVFINKELASPDMEKPWDVFAQDIKSNFIAPELLDAMDYLRREFRAEIGLPDSNQQKKERLITAEVESRNSSVKGRAQLWLDTINRHLEAANRMFGTSMRMVWREGEENAEKRDTEPTGPIPVG